jgi:transglutaminase-like putative cysteine protease
MPDPDDYLAPTAFVDANHPEIRAFAEAVAGGADTDVERVARLFRDVRDRIAYDPYVVDLRPEVLRASAVLRSERNWCVPKAVLLAAGCRAVGIPAALGFADVRNHLASDRLLALLGTDLFAWHGYVAVHVGGRWFKVTPAFNASLCDRFGVPPLEFDGTGDALLHAFDGDGAQYMEYVTDHGLYADLPFDEIVAGLATTYGDRMAGSGGDHDDAVFHGS